MNTENKDRFNIGLVLFAFGVLLGVVLNVMTIWGDLEAFLFDASIGADENIKTLKCPMMITSNETGLVTASFTNPADRELILTVIARVSEGRVTFMREMKTLLPMAAGETRQMSWEVSPEDAAYDRFILVRVHSLRINPIPSRTSSCGILVVGVPFLTGNQLFVLILLGAVISMTSGAWIWSQANRPFTKRNQEAWYAMIALVIVLLAAMIFGFMGSWFVGGLLFLLSLLLIVLMLTHL